MIIEILMLVAAATIFIILARRFPATSQEIETGPALVPSVAKRSGQFLDLGLVQRFWAMIRRGVSRIQTPRFDFIRKPRLNRSVTRDLETTLDQAKQYPGSGGFHKRKDQLNRLVATDHDILVSANEAFASQDFDRAERLYLKAALQTPKESKIYSRLGVIYLDKKNYRDAKEALIMAIKLGDEVAARYYNLALAYAGLREVKKSLVSIKKALDIDPGNEKYLKLMEKLVG